MPQLLHLLNIANVQQPMTTHLFENCLLVNKLEYPLGGADVRVAEKERQRPMQMRAEHRRPSILNRRIPRTHVNKSPTKRKKKPKRSKLVQKRNKIHPKQHLPATTFMERIDESPQPKEHLTRSESQSPDSVHQEQLHIPTTLPHAYPEPLSSDEDAIEEEIEEQPHYNSRRPSEHHRFSSNELYVGNLDHALVDARVMKDLFQKVVGPVVHCEIPRQRGDDARGFAFVRFLYSRDAVRASKMQGLVLDHRPLVLMLKKK